MNIVENSITYRWLAGSWLLGWLVAAPSSYDGYYQGSMVYRWTDSLISGFIGRLGRLGHKISGWGDTSWLLARPLMVLGWLALLAAVGGWYGGGTGWKWLIIKLFLTGLAPVLLMVEKYPGIYQGSLPGRAINWWLENE